MDIYEKQYKKYLEQFLENIRELTYQRLKKDCPNYNVLLENQITLSLKREKILNQLSVADRKVIEDYWLLDLEIKLLEGDRLYINGLIDGVKIGRGL